MKTVLICIPMLNNAGAQRFVTELAINLDRQRFRAIVVTTSRSLPESEFHRQLVDGGIEVKDVSDGNYLKEIKNIRALLKQYSPDIVHSNIGSALHVLVPVWMQGKKTVHIFTAHSMGYRIFTGAKKKLMQFAFKTCKIIPVGICDTVKKSICESYGLSEDKVPCVYNGVDTEKFTPKESYCKDGLVNFISVGTLYGLKNHSMLIDAFSIVRKSAENVKLTIVGGGELHSALDEQIRALGLEGDVMLVGDRPNVADYLSSADVYCCPSKVEGLPITVLEAMSVGLPIITTPAGGVVDIVKDGENGYIVPHNDAKAMAEKMLLLASSINIIEEKGKSSRKEALQYDEKLCVKGYEIIYDTYK